MASALITTRHTKSGPRYVVRYRLGGRAYGLQHGGSFRTMKEARARRDLIAGELANGRNPADLLGSMGERSRRRETLSEWRDRYLESRIDIDINTMKGYRTALKKVCERFGNDDPYELKPSDVAEWVSGLATTHKPGTVQLYLIAFRLLLDFAGCDPNPARDPRVKLPKRVREEPQPPSSEHFLAILDAMGEKWRLLFVTMEQGALRLGEAVNLKWGDVDAAGLRLRLPRSATKRDKPGGSTCPSGSWRRSRRRARTRTGSRSGACSRGSRRRPRIRRCSGPARTPRCPTTARMTYVIAGSQSGTSREYPPANSRNAPDMPDPR